MGREDLFCTVLLCILSTSSSLLLMLGPYHFCPLSSPALHEISLGISNFLEEISSLSHSVVFLYFFALIPEEGFLISLLFFGTLHSDAYIFPFLLCLSLLFFSQLFIRPPQTVILLFCISFSWGWSRFLSPVQYHEPPSIVHQALYQI